MGIYIIYQLLYAHPLLGNLALINFLSNSNVPLLQIFFLNKKETNFINEELQRLERHNYGPFLQCCLPTNSLIYYNK